MSTLAEARLALLLYIKGNTPAFMWGPPGVGKSDLVRQIADELKYNLIDFRAVLRDPVDLRGIPTVDEKTQSTKWLVPNELPNEKRDGKHGIFFMDELNAANAQVQAACFGLVLDRKLGDYTLPKGWVIIAAGNRQSDRSAAQRMPRALANRFAHIDVDADADVWINDYGLNNCSEILVSFIRFRKGLIHDMDSGDDERTFPSPRAWAQVDKYIDAPDNIRFTMFKGLVGNGPATELNGFIATWRDLPDLDDIVARPKSTQVPTEPSAMYAVSGALGRFANRDNFDAIMTYAMRLDREYEIIICLDATKRDPSLTKTKAYIEFVKRNKDIQIGQFRTAA